MSDDLPSVEAEATVETEQEQPQTESTSETVSDTEGTPEEKPTFSPEQHAAAALAYEGREAKRNLKAAQEELEKLKAGQAETRPETGELDEFASKEEVDAWQDKVRKQAVFDAQQHALQQQNERTAYDQQVAAQNAQVQKRQTFVENATKAGINGTDLQTAANLVDSHGLNPAIVESILGDPDGGLVLLQLSTDPVSIQALNSADVMTLGSIYAGIKEKAATLKPKQSEAPTPADILAGNGAPPTTGGPPGVTYE